MRKFPNKELTGHLARAGHQVEDFGGGEGEPDEAVGENQRAENAPDEQARAIGSGGRFERGNLRSAGAPACPFVPEVR